MTKYRSIFWNNVFYVRNESTNFLKLLFFKKNLGLQKKKLKKIYNNYNMIRCKF